MVKKGSMTRILLDTPAAGISTPLRQDELAWIAIEGLEYTLKIILSYLRSQGPPQRNPTPSVGLSTYLPNILNRQWHRRNKSPWNWKRLPLAAETPALATKEEKAQETPGTPARQPPPPRAPGSCFPSYNNNALDYAATTALLLSRLLFTMILCYVLLLLLCTYLTPNSFNGFLEFFTDPNQTPTQPSRRLFLRGRPYYDES